tara:strand:+ start:3865 stop:5001 length:1137 start_codon:yes stop_codon:yes gene_type:complete
MAFFNKKQEVIDLKLTPYGEELLARGIFKPEYYAFFDDNILYDASGSAGITEVQNDAEPRIQEETPQLRTQYVFKGSDTTTGTHIRDAWEAMGSFADYTAAGFREHLHFWGNIPLAALRLTEFQVDSLMEPLYYAEPSPTLTPGFPFVEPLGTMRLGSEHIPSWDIKVLNGELSGAINYLTSSIASSIHNNVRRIPQLDFDINYRVLIGNTRFMEINAGLRDRIISEIFADGTFLYLSQETPNLILSIDEQNSSDDVEYDIEVFLMQTGSSGDDSGPTLMPLSFQQQPARVVNGILLDDSEIPNSKDEELDSSYVEYFFQVNADLEIAEEEICPKITDLRSRGTILDDIPYECPDVKKVNLLDIYGTNIREDDVEVCD